MLHKIELELIFYVFFALCIWKNCPVKQVILYPSILFSDQYTQNFFMKWIWILMTSV